MMTKRFKSAALLTLVLFLHTFSAYAAVPLFGPKARFFDNAGLPLNGGQVFTYTAGTTTPKNSYTDSGGLTPNANPVILDSSGYGNIYLGSGSYKIVLEDSANNVLFTTDNYAGDVTSGFAGAVYAITTNTNVNSTYKNAVLICTNTINLSLVSAVTATAGYAALIRDDGSGNVTITANGGDTINGASSLVLKPGESAIISSDGISSWKTIGYFSFNTNGITGTETSIVSATTTDLGTATGYMVSVTGTTTITSFGSSASTAAPLYLVRFTGALTLTHNGSSLILPGSANITTAAGDSLIAEYLGSGNWKVLSYSPLTGRTVAGMFPTFQYLTSGTGATYTTPANVKELLVQCIGGGGGGGAITTNAGGTGGTTTFNSVQAIGGGGGGIYAVTGKGGTGGTGGTGSATFRVAGGDGQGLGTIVSATVISGGTGANGVWGGGGRGGLNSEAGQNGKANTGGGGGGAGGSGSGASGGAAGGGAGEYFELVITNPAATYTYTIGTAGTGGAAGGFAGGNGATGLCIVREYY